MMHLHDTTPLKVNEPDDEGVVPLLTLEDVDRTAGDILAQTFAIDTSLLSSLARMSDAEVEECLHAAIDKAITLEASGDYAEAGLVWDEVKVIEGRLAR